MTTTLFTDARLIDPDAGTDAPGWLLVDKGVIAATGTGEDRPAAERVIECGGHCLAPGIVDIGVKVCEPGERHKESYRSAGLAAAAGGVTTMATRPDTLPAIDSPEVLEFARRRANEASPLNVLPMAALAVIVALTVGMVMVAG
jgi:dihydroorotase